MADDDKKKDSDYLIPLNSDKQVWVLIVILVPLGIFMSHLLFVGIPGACSGSSGGGGSYSGGADDWNDVPLCPRCP